MSNDNKQGWIAVSEVEPELSKQYLCFDPTAVVQMYTAFWMPIATTEKAAYFTNGNNIYFGVSHYASLLTPPGKANDLK